MCWLLSLWLRSLFVQTPHGAELQTEVESIMKDFYIYIDILKIHMYLMLFYNNSILTMLSNLFAKGKT